MRVSQSLTPHASQLPPPVSAPPTPSLLAILSGALRCGPWLLSGQLAQPVGPPLPQGPASEKRGSGAAAEEQGRGDTWAGF